MAHVKVIKRSAASAYVGRWRSADGTRHQTSAHSTVAGARTAAEEQAAAEERVHAFQEDGYWVGRYLSPHNRWLETDDGFDTADNALAEARELEQAARAAVPPKV